MSTTQKNLTTFNNYLRILEDIAKTFKHSVIKEKIDDYENYEKTVEECEVLTEEEKINIILKKKEFLIKEWHPIVEHWKPFYTSYFPRFKFDDGK